MKNVLEGTIGGTFTQESPKQARKCFPALKRVQNVKHVCAIQIVKTNSITFQITLQLKSDCQILHESCKLPTIILNYVFLKIACNKYANKHSHTNVHYFEHHLSNSHTMSSNNNYHEYKQSIKHTCKHSMQQKCTKMLRMQHNCKILIANYLATNFKIRILRFWTIHNRIYYL
jgi:hypothetical protein